MEVEVGEVCVAGGSKWASGVVGVDAVEVDRGGAEHVGECRFGLASVAAAVDVYGPHGL